MEDAESFPWIQDENEGRSNAFSIGYRSGRQYLGAERGWKVRTLLAVLFLVGSTHAQDSTRVEPTTRWALGVGFPSFSGRGISLWRVNPDVALGLGISPLRYTRNNSEQVRSEWGDQNHLESWLLLTVLDFRRPIRENISPFLFYRLGGFYGFESYQDTPEASTIQKRILVNLGIGVAWTPVSRIGLWVRQGVGLMLKRSDLGKNGAYTQMLEVGTAYPSAVAYFSF